MIGNCSDIILFKEWTPFIPTVDAITTAPTLATTHEKKASYKVIGKSLHIIWGYSHIFATGSAAGTGNYLFPIPAGYTIDTSMVDLASDENSFGYGTPVGNGAAMQDSASGNIIVLVYDANCLTIAANNWIGLLPIAYKFINSTHYAFNINNHKVMFTAEIPIC